MIVPYIPKELLNIILDYDGRIKYRKGEYINIIHKNDLRYNIIQNVIAKKIVILNETLIENISNFYFAFGFDTNEGIGLCYDYNYSRPEQFEICYFDFRNGGIKQIRTYL
jgi:hypothetical protein